MSGIAAKYFKRLTPIMIIAVGVLVAGIWWYDWQRQIEVSLETGGKSTAAANNTLRTWLDDQINIVRTLSEDPRVIAACANPTDPATVNIARIFLKSVHAKYSYYENIPLMAKLPPNVTLEIDVAGKKVPVKSGQFFMDTVDNKTIGKGGEAARFIKEPFAGNPYFISHVYPSLLRGNPIFVVSAPVKKDGAVIGAVIVAPQMNYFTDRFINSIKAGQTGSRFFGGSSPFAAAIAVGLCLCCPIVPHLHASLVQQVRKIGVHAATNKLAIFVVVVVLRGRSGFYSCKLF